MASQGIPKMSLVAQYDDLCRYTKVLTSGCEDEFKVFVESQKSLFRRVKDLEAEVLQLKKENTKLESKNSALDCRMKQVGSLIEAEIEQKRILALEKQALEDQINAIKKVLLADGNTIDQQTREKIILHCNATLRQTEPRPRLTTIEESVGSLLSASDIDETDEDIDPHVSRRRKRRSAGKRSNGNQKKKRSSGETVFYFKDSDDVFRMEFDEGTERKANPRSSSEPNGNSPEVPTPPRQVHRSDSEQIKTRTYNLRVSTGSLPSGTPVGRFSTGGKLSRTHAFVSKTVIRQEKCYPCGSIVKFLSSALKCSDCRITCHPHCKDQCPLPCIPVTFTPTKATSGTLNDYVSSTSPMIPSIIVHCVNEIEARGLKEIGLYRIPGSDREVKDLKDKLIKGRSMSALNNADIHAICGTIKEFLRSLKDSLITRLAWRTFVEAADNSDETTSLNLLYNAVCDLPQPNKETLAFLILHLQRVAASPDCKMPLDNLAKIFGPTIVGYSALDIADADMLKETQQQCRVMQRLLDLPTDSWENILNIDVCQSYMPYVKTPELTPAPVVSRLGPIYASGHNTKPKSIQVGRTPLTPRNVRSITKTGKKQFFTSPLLK